MPKYDYLNFENDQTNLGECHPTQQVGNFWNSSQS